MSLVRAKRLASGLDLCGAGSRSGPPCLMVQPLAVWLGIRRTRLLSHVLYVGLGVEEAMDGFHFFPTKVWKCFKAGNKNTWAPLPPSPSSLHVP